MSKFEIEPRDASIGGGWHLKLYDDGIEMGGGVFPMEPDVTSDDAYADALQTGKDWLCSQSRMDDAVEWDAREG